MTGEEFLQLYLNDIELRQFIVDLVKAYTPDPGRRAHLLYTAWIDISNGKYGMDKDYYYRRVYCALRREWEERYLEKHVKYGCKSPAIRRAGYVVSKFSEKTL